MYGVCTTCGKETKACEAEGCSEKKLTASSIFDAALDDITHLRRREMLEECEALLNQAIRFYKYHRHLMAWNIVLIVLNAFAAIVLFVAML